MDNKEARRLAAELREDAPKLDLHGVHPDRVEDMLDQFLTRHAETVDSVEIIFGIGTGKLGGLVAAILEKHPLVESVEQKPGRCIILFDK